MESDMEDVHSIWNGRFKANPKEAKFFLEIIDKLAARFDFEDAMSEIIQFFWGESRDVLDKLIKQSNKREKKKETLFVPKDLKKPSNASILFGKDYKKQCDSKGVKFNQKDKIEAWKKLSDKEKAKYQKQVEEAMKVYEAEYAKQRSEAIKSGEFPEDKPKKPNSSYFLFMAEMRPKLIEKYKDLKDKKEANQKVMTESAEMWNALAPEKKVKYENEYKKAKVEYDVKLEEWNTNESNRRNKQEGKGVNVKIETNGKKNTTKPKEDVPAEAPIEAATAAEEKPKQKATKSKSVPKPKVESEHEDDDVKAEVEVAVEPVQPPVQQPVQPPVQDTKPKQKSASKAK
jgi:hypothetical protein